MCVVVINDDPWLDCLGIAHDAASDVLVRALGCHGYLPAQHGISHKLLLRISPFYSYLADMFTLDYLFLVYVCFFLRTITFVHMFGFLQV